LTYGNCDWQIKYTFSWNATFKYDIQNSDH
jgi:hypothetical protein